MPTGTPGRTHGLASTYNSGGCRCDACRLAASRYYYKHTREEHLALVEAPHGTETRFKRCRCDACRAAATQARRERRAANPEAAREYDREYRRRKRAAA